MRAHLEPPVGTPLGQTGVMCTLPRSFPPPDWALPFVPKRVRAGACQDAGLLCSSPSVPVLRTSVLEFLEPLAAPPSAWLLGTCPGGVNGGPEGRGPCPLLLPFPVGGWGSACLLFASVQLHEDDHLGP